MTRDFRVRGHAMLQQEGADLIDNAGTLTDQSLTHAVERPRVELLGGPGPDEPHRPSCTASAIASASRKSSFCPLEYGRTYFAGMSRASCPKHPQLATEMMRVDTSLHADETRRQHLPA